jgi:hypothetical protein
MKKTIFAVAVLSAALSVSFIAGCTRECEVRCTEGGQTYISRLPEMKQSECEELNEKSINKNDSCTYKWAD